jgi:ornithine decarboxylase
MDYPNLCSLVERYGTPTVFISESRIRTNFRTMQSALPGVELYYAVKSNGHDDLVRVLRDEGASFDLASNGEIDLMRSCDISAQRCIHTHPVKRDSDIRYALDYGIRIFVADNEQELQKLVPYKDHLSVLIRLSIKNPFAVVNLSHKFGVAPENAFSLIKKAHAMGLDIEGLAFHVGSQNENIIKYIEALEYCRDICKMAALAGITLRTIDIGGGFPIDYLSPVMPMQQFCQSINEYLERYFANYRIIAEPGRSISGSTATLAARVMGKSLRDGVRWYFIDDGVYGSFSGKIYDHAEYPMQLAKSGERYTSTIAGPTCDSIDILYENIALPELEIGDILMFESMGSYTIASASTFNGIPKPRVVMIE